MGLSQEQAAACSPGSVDTNASEEEALGFLRENCIDSWVLPTMIFIPHLVMLKSYPRVAAVDDLELGEEVSLMAEFGGDAVVFQGLWC